MRRNKMVSGKLQVVPTEVSSVTSDLLGAIVKIYEGIERLEQQPPVAVVNRVSAPRLVRHL